MFSKNVIYKSIHLCPTTITQKLIKEILTFVTQKL